MGWEGAKMGTQRGQEGAREAQVVPRSSQKKGHKIDAVLKPFWNSFGGPVGPPAVIRGILEASFFWNLFWNPSWGRQTPKFLDFGPYVLKIEGQT